MFDFLQNPSIANLINSGYSFYVLLLCLCSAIVAILRYVLKYKDNKMNYELDASKYAIDALTKYYDGIKLIIVETLKSIGDGMPINDIDKAVKVISKDLQAVKLSISALAKDIRTLKKDVKTIKETEKKKGKK
jgi:hypothetical protein